MSEARPILKWAGGKRQLLPALREFYPPAFKIYFEPFLGSAAVFLDLHNRRMLGRGARLSDCSADLIGCYIAVRDAVEEVIAELERLAEEHRDRGSAHYYEVRNRRFNPMRRELAGQPSAPYPPELAAMLIYLNRTGYNGLFRLNARSDLQRAPPGGTSVRSSAMPTTPGWSPQRFVSPCVTSDSEPIDTARAS